MPSQLTPSLCDICNNPHWFREKHIFNDRTMKLPAATPRKPTTLAVLPILPKTFVLKDAPRDAEPADSQGTPIALLKMVKPSDWLPPPLVTKSQSVTKETSVTNSPKQYVTRGRPKSQKPSPAAERKRLSRQRAKGNG